MVSYKSEDYWELTVGEFDQSLASADDLSALFEDYATVAEKISEDDENYDFITVTMNASLNEIYREALKDQTGFECRIEKLGDPVEPMNEAERELLEAEPLYEFQFHATCYVHYQITDKTCTVSERDSVLKAFQDDLQSFADTLNEESIADGNVKALLEEKAQKIADHLDTDKIEVDFDIQII